MVSVTVGTQEVATVSDRVTINVVNGSIGQVLNAFSRQTGRNIVLGPSVTNTVNLRLNDTPWDEALDVLLKPYGLGYRLVGKTIVVNQLSELQTFESIETLTSRVFTLKYLDASDVIDMISRQLTTNRGSVTILAVQGQKGWEFESMSGGSRGSSGGVGGAGIRQRVQGAEKQIRSKTLIVKDTAAVLDSIEKILLELDKMPAQVLIESRFVEVSSDFLRDIGLEFGTGATGAEAPGVQAQGYRSGGNAYGLGAQSISGGVIPSAFQSASGTTLAGQSPFAAGFSLKFQQLTDTQFEILMHMLQEDASMNVLSAPRILTLNNQEAAISVGQKFPIIKSDVSGGNNSGTVSTSLDYYESIGIQLNVVPQVCGDGYISMIVHPAVTDFVKTEGGVVATSSGTTQTTQYPVLSTREADTQIVLKNGSTIVIGGLLKNSEARTELKVPLFGDIPVLGNLFRRTTSRKEKLDLLIFLTATIVPSMEPLDVEAAARAVDRVREANAAGDRRYEEGVSAGVKAEQAASARRAVASDRKAEEEAAALRRREAAKQMEAAREAERARAEQDRAAKETSRLQAEQAEKARLVEARKQKEAELARRAEKERQDAELARQQERMRQAEKDRLAEAKRQEAEQARKIEAARQAEKELLAAQRKAKEEEARKAEEKRVADAKAAREAERMRIAQRRAQIAEQRRQKEAQEVKAAADLKAREEEAAKAEARKAADVRAAQLALKTRIAQEEAQLAAERKQQDDAEAKLAAEQETAAQAAREDQKARLAEARKLRAEEARKAEEVRKAEVARLAAERKQKGDQGFWSRLFGERSEAPVEGAQAPVAAQ